MSLVTTKATHLVSALLNISWKLIVTKISLFDFYLIRSLSLDMFLYGY